MIKEITYIFGYDCFIFRGFDIQINIMHVYCAENADQMGDIFCSCGLCWVYITFTRATILPYVRKPICQFSPGLQLVHALHIEFALRLRACTEFNFHITYRIRYFFQMYLFTWTYIVDECTVYDSLSLNSFYVRIYLCAYLCKNYVPTVAYLFFVSYVSI